MDVFSSSKEGTLCLSIPQSVEYFGGYFGVSYLSDDGKQVHNVRFERLTRTVDSDWHGASDDGTFWGPGLMFEFPSVSASGIAGSFCYYINIMQIKYKENLSITSFDILPPFNSHGNFQCSFIGEKIHDLFRTYGFDCDSSGFDCAILHDGS